MDFSQHCAVVTGGSSGIGRACASALARAGAKVVLTYFADPGEADDVLAEIRSGHGEAIARQVDVGDEASVEALFAAAEERFGPVTLLVNCAGLNMSGTAIAAMELAQFDKVLRADLYGPFLTCRRLVRGLAADDAEPHRDVSARESRTRPVRESRARIVNISSIHEFAPRPGAVDYDAAKGGLKQLTRTLALELAPQRIAVNGVAPGMILTPMNAAAMQDDAVLDEKEAHIPWGRAGTPEDVADLVLFLLSPRSAYVTGTTVTIDGALSLCIAQDA